MQQYHDMMRHILAMGRDKTDRTGTGTRSIFGYQMRFNLAEGFPLVTTKKVHMKSIIHELIWFLAGDTNIRYLKENGVSIWDEWADANGDLGPVYGGQWRRWQDVKVFSQTSDRELIEKYKKLGYQIVGEIDPSYMSDEVVYKKEIDQISDIVNLLKTSPDSRRIIVSAWNVGDIPNMKLPPCHSLFQLYTDDLTLDERVALAGANLGVPVQMVGDGGEEAAHYTLDTLGVPRKRLSCQLYQRSADVFLGVPFNIASYAILTHMLAQQCDMAVGDFVWSGGDIHIYSNHFEQVELQLTRSPKLLPELVIKRRPESIFDYKFEDFEVVGYNPDPAIKAPVAV